MKKKFLKIKHFFLKPLFYALHRTNRVNIKLLELQSQIAQQTLVSNYQVSSYLGTPSLKLHQIGFKQFSENLEDGILLYIFSRIGTINRKCVEIGCGYGAECNTANLILNHNWHGLLIDKGKEETDYAREYYFQKKNMKYGSPIIKDAHITRDNINTILKDSGFQGEIDLLSIDIDGTDYWIWKAVEVINPRVVLVEVQCIWGSQVSVTVPYSDKFEAGFIDGYGIYSGASLSAFQKLAAKKGYRFVGVENRGYNVFFVRNDISEKLIPKEDLSVIDTLPFVQWAKEKYLDLAKNRKWERV